MFYLIEIVYSFDVQKERKIDRLYLRIKLPSFWTVTLPNITQNTGYLKDYTVDNTAKQVFKASLFKQNKRQR